MKHTSALPRQCRDCGKPTRRHANARYCYACALRREERTRNHNIAAYLCEVCGTTFAATHWSYPVCPECRKRTKFRTTQPFCPDLYDPKQVACYRPDGDASEVWETIRMEASR